MKRSRSIIVLLCCITSIALTLSGLFYGILMTTEGANIILPRVLKLFPGKITIQEISGQLSSPLKLKNIRFSNQEMEVRIDQLLIRWNPKQLLKKIIMIEEVDVRTLSITRFNETPSTTPYTLKKPSYFNELQLNKMHISNFHYNDTQKKHYQIDDVKANKINPSTYALNVMSPHGNIKGNLSFTWKRALRWNINLQNENIDLRSLSPLQEGKINFLLASQGRFGKHLTFTLKLSDVDGHVNQYPIKGQSLIVYKKGEFQTLNAHFTLHDAVLDLSGSLKKAWQANWSIVIPTLQTFLPDYRGDFSSNGTLHGTAMNPLIIASFKSHQLKANGIAIHDVQGNLKSSEDAKETRVHLKMTTKKINSDYYPVHATEINIDSNIRKQQLTANINAFINQVNHIKGTMTLPRTSLWLDTMKPIAGRFELSIPQIKTLPIHIPNAVITSGSGHGIITLNGTLTKPHYDAHLFIHDANIDIKKLGIALKNINLEGKTPNQTSIEYNGHFFSGKGLGKVKGILNLEKPILDTSLHLSGNDLSLANLSEYKITASPNVDINYKGSDIRVTGDVSIPSAKITPIHLHEVTSLPTDVIFVQRRDESFSIFNNLSTHLQLTLAKDTIVHYDTLKASITGNLALIKQKNGPFTASGLLYTLSGKYTAYGKELDIEEGRLTYAGNLLDNPGLSIRAVKIIKLISTGGESPLLQTESVQPIYTGSSTVTIGVMVYGTLENPLISLFSNPATLSPEDILSYLLFGYPRSSITSASSMMLLNNALTSSKNGVNIGTMTGKVQENLGLNEFGVQTVQYYNVATHSTDNATAFTVGKSLGERLSLHYSIGLFEPISVLNARFKLTDAWVLQAETNVLENGIDLLYEIEKD